MKGSENTGQKRYYWLKLQDGFFTSKRIKKLRRLAGGDTYTIIYLKMQLLAMKTDGVLRWTGLENDFASELALDLDEDAENVAVTMHYLLSCGLAESSDNINFFFPYAVENTGCETSAAKRMRDMRDRNSALQKLKETPKTNSDRQRAFRAKQTCETKQHIPMIEDYTNKKRYGGNYYLVCQREKFKCAICDSEENLCVHHIDGYDELKPENNALNKMLLLCRTCHSNVHAGTPIPQYILDGIEYDRNVTESVTPMLRERYGEKEIDIEIDKEKEIEIDKEPAAAKPRTKKPFVPPTLEEVTAYVKQRNSSVDPKRFFDYFQAGDWTDSKGNKVRNWKQKLITWEGKNDEKKGEKRVLTFMDL